MVDAFDAKGRTVPWMSNVIFGCVSVKGAVVTEATGRDKDDEAFDDEGSETTKGRRGEVKAKVGGAGSMMVAEACIVRLFESLYTLNDLRVTRSEKEGIWPG